MDKIKIFKYLSRAQSVFIAILSFGYLTLFFLPFVSSELDDRLGETKFVIFAVLGVGCILLIVLRAFIYHFRKQIAITDETEIKKVLSSNEPIFKVGIFLALIFLLVFFSWLGLFALSATDGRPSGIIFAIIFYGGILLVIVTSIVRLFKKK